MNHKLFKLISISLILMTSLSISACNKTNKDNTIKENKVISISSPDSEQIDIETTSDNFDSLTKLREKLENSDADYAVAYLGYVGGLFENSYEEDFPKWLKENNQELLKEYPFILDIDNNHIINKAGYLYCIVLKDKKATLAINSVKWNKESQSEELVDVLYRQETGEPILLFCNYDEITYEPDTVLYITDNSGKTCKSYPLGDQSSKLVSCLSDDEACTWIDFSSLVPNEDNNLNKWINEGWSKVSLTDLAGNQDLGMAWITEISTSSNKIVYYQIRFFLDDTNGGSVRLTYSYKGQYLEEEWTGFWSLDSDSNLVLELTLVGGEAYDSYDGPRYISDTFPVLKNSYGTKLLIASGKNNISLPFLSKDNSIYILEQGAG